LFFAALAFAVRPTSGVFWVFLAVFHLFTLRTWKDRFYFVFGQALPVGLGVWAVSMIVDFYFYGRWVVVPWNFLRFNVVQKISSFYGVHSWHWYITQGLPVMVFTFLPLMAVGIWKGVSHSVPLLLLFVWGVAVFSLLPHKEFRFLFPLLPLAHIYSGHGLRFVSAYLGADDTPPRTWWFSSASSRKALPPKRGGGRKRLTPKSGAGRPLGVLMVCAVLVISHGAMICYFSYAHQRGPIDVMAYLRANVHVLQNPEADMRVDFLMPCHATPYYAYIHRNISMDFIQCLPPLKTPQGETIVDESRSFFAGPIPFLEGRYAKPKPWPTHLVMFDSLLPRVQSFLDQHSYHLCATIFHSFFVTEEEQGKNIFVFCDSAMVDKLGSLCKQD
jgi:phosphatidylinositol glycan class B